MHPYGVVKGDSIPLDTPPGQRPVGSTTTTTTTKRGRTARHDRHRVAVGFDCVVLPPRQGIASLRARHPRHAHAIERDGQEAAKALYKWRCAWLRAALDSDVRSALSVKWDWISMR